MAEALARALDYSHSTNSMTRVEQFCQAVKAGDAKSAILIAMNEKVVGGNLPDMMVEMLISLQREVDELKAKAANTEKDKT